MAVDWQNIGICTAIKTLILLSAVHFSDATQYIVADATGWTLPSYGHVNYTVWASSHTFHVGDSLLFNYRADLHNVLEVSQSDYEACSNSKPLRFSNDGKSVIPLTSAGSNYFICGVDGHCIAGQKVQIKVLAGESESPLPSAISPGGPIPRGISHTPVEAPSFSGSNQPAGVIGFVLTMVAGAIGTIFIVFA